MLSIFIAPAVYDGDGTVLAEAQRFVDYVKASPPAVAGQPVLGPGDVERRTRAARLASGVPLDDKTWTDLLEAAQIGRHRRGSARLSTESAISQGGNDATHRTLDCGSRARDRIHARRRAGLAEQADPLRRAVRGGRQHRHPGAHDRREAVGRARPAGRRREQAGRRRRSRCGRSRESAAGRLHDHGRHDQHARDQRVAVHDLALRSGEGLRGDHADRARAEHARRQQRRFRPRTSPSSSSS